MNDWDIKETLILVISIQLGLLGSIGLDFIGFNIPILRQLLGFIYLSFIPGVLLLRILKLHKLGDIETSMYAIGLSLSTLMFAGFSVNLIYPLLGFERPISLVPLIVTISAIMLILCILSYMVDKDFSNPSTVKVSEILSPSLLFLCLIPFLSIFGTYLVNFHHTNIILMLMIVVIAMIVLLISFDKFIPSKLYPFAIWIMTISLIWHNTLISPYLNIFDVTREYYFTKLVIDNNYWNFTLDNNYNAVLCNVILGPIYHYICNIDLTWILKIIYQFFFSFVPVGLYRIFEKRTDNKMAFVSCFLFLSIQPVYTVISSTTKQSTSEFFFALILMLLFNTVSMKKMKESFLLIVFSVSMVISHYGTSYLVLASFIFVFTLLQLQQNKMIMKKWEKINLNINKNSFYAKNSIAGKPISFNFLILFLVVTLTWYIFISSSSAFYSIVSLFNHIKNTIFTDFLDPDSSRGLYLLLRDRPSVLATIYKYFHIGIQFLISLGLLMSLFNYRRGKFESKYLFFSLYFFMLNLAAIAVSYLAVMNPSRLYHLSLFFLAPFSVFGAVIIYKLAISKILKMPWTYEHKKKSLRIFSIILIFYFLFNVGFIFEIANESFTSISISQDNFKNLGSDDDISTFYYNYMPEQDIFSAEWLSNRILDKDEAIVYATLGHGQGKASLISYGMIPPNRLRMLNDNTKTMEEGAYIYLHYVNVIENIGFDQDIKLGRPINVKMDNIFANIKNKNKIYDNNGSEILLN